MYLIGVKFHEEEVEVDKEEKIIDGKLVVKTKTEERCGYRGVDPLVGGASIDMVNFFNKVMESLEVYRMNKSSEKGFYYLYDSTEKNIDGLKEDIEKSIKDIIQKDRLKRVYGYDPEKEADTFFGVYDNVIITKELEGIERLILTLAMAAEVREESDEISKLEGADASMDKFKYIAVERFLRRPYQFLYDYANLANGKPLDDDPKKRRPKK